MKRLSSTLVTRIVFGLSCILIAAAAAAAPCTTATSTCTEAVTPPESRAHTLVYRTYPLTARNESITRALVVVHGRGRDAENYFRTVLAAAFLANALQDTVIISPRFASNNGKGCRDALAPDEINWNCPAAPDGWRVGGGIGEDARVTTFDIVDTILRKLAVKEAFPNLKKIVVAGHSAGGQFVSRYEMSNQVHDGLGAEIVYVVANPSSYAYPDDLRPTANAFPTNIAALPPGYHAPPAASPGEPFQAFADARNCSTYDQWPYGLQHRAGYSARMTDEVLKKQLAARSTTYLLGELDILPLYGFDSSCPAMAQGATRLARGLAYTRYVNEKYGARDKDVVVLACGHSARCMFTSDIALPVLFPKSTP